MALNFGVDLVGSNVIAQGDYFHPADATPDGFFTHWSTLSNIGPVTINVTNESTVTVTVRVLRFSGPAVDIDVSPQGVNSSNNRSVTVPDAQALQIQEETADVVGEYLIVKN